MQASPAVAARKNPTPAVSAAAVKKIGKVARAPKDPSSRRLPTPATIIPPLPQLMHQAACSMPDQSLTANATAIAHTALVTQGKQLAKVLSVAAASSPSCVGLHSWVVSACSALESSWCEESQLRQSLATSTTVNEQMHLYMNTTHRLVVRQKRSLEQSYAALLADADAIRKQLAEARATIAKLSVAAPLCDTPPKQLSVSTASPVAQSSSSPSPRLVFDTSSLEPSPMSLGTPRPTANTTSSLPLPSPRPSTAYSFGPALLSVFPPAPPSLPSSSAPSSPLPAATPSPCYSLFSGAAPNAPSSTPSSTSPACSSPAMPLQVSPSMECDSDAPLPSPTVVAPVDAASANGADGSSADAIEGILRQELMSLRALRNSVHKEHQRQQQSAGQPQAQQQPMAAAATCQQQQQHPVVKLRRSKSSEKRGVTLTGVTHTTTMVRALSVPPTSRHDSASNSSHRSRSGAVADQQPSAVEPLLRVSDVAELTTCDNQWLALGRRVIMPASAMMPSASRAVTTKDGGVGVQACALPSELSLALLATSIGTPRAQPSSAVIGATTLTAEATAPLSSSCPSFSMMRAARGFTRRHTS